MKVQYEELIQQPEATLRGIGDRFGLDVGDVIQKVERDMPLRRGYVFNGNRMRMQEQVVFRKKPAVTSK